MGTENEVAESLEEIQAELRRMIDGNLSPYDAARGISARAWPLISVSPDTMLPLWTIWSIFKNWIEKRPSEAIWAESKMRDAAAGWFELKPNVPSERVAYFERWIYDELGYGDHKQ